MQSNFSTLCRGHIIPKELDRETTTKFLEACEQFERIMNDSGLVRLRRLSTDEIVGTEGKTGLIERYFSLMPEGDTTLQDIELSAREMRIGDNRLCLHTLSDAEDLPGKVATDTRYEKLSTDRSDCRLSFASPVGLLLSCNHIYNQYVLIDNSEETLQKFEKSARNMQSLSRYSRSNSINREWIDQYLNEAHSYGLTSVRAHFNVMAWSDDAEELKHIKNDVGSQLASMECVRATTPSTARHSTGRRYPAMRRTSRRKRVSTPSSNRRCACSQRKPTTAARSRPSASRWWTGSRENRCTLTSPTCP